MTIPIDHIPGSPQDAGLLYGRALADLRWFHPTFLHPYLAAFCDTNQCTPDDLPVQAARWLANLPPHHQLQIDAMATGARTPTSTLATFLYADIARPSHPTSCVGRLSEPPSGIGRLSEPTPPPPSSSPSPSPFADVTDDPLPGPGCSGLITRLAAHADGHPPSSPRLWVARNCDWLYPLLRRGTAAVLHAVPGRIPTLALGVRGDIDVDTGCNAAGLWLHLHTLLAVDDPPRDRTTISWLFWAREALETCESLDDLEAFITRTGRDRGVIAVAVDARRQQGAVFECTKGAHTRHDFQGPALFCTNHPQAKPIDAAREAAARPGGTVARFAALRSILRDHPPEVGPDDLIDTLADPAVEMRTPTWLRTIYSVVVQPAARTGGTWPAIWMASGDATGRPAASTGAWQRLRVTLD